MNLLLKLYISFPDKKHLFSLKIIGLGSLFFTKSAIALICEKCVPQHPPRIFTCFLSTNSFKYPVVISGVSSYSPFSLGSPAFGYNEIYLSVKAAIFFIIGIRSLAPKEQLSPKEMIEGLSRATINDSMLCPEKIFPCLFTVAEIIIGS